MRLSALRLLWFLLLKVGVYADLHSDAIRCIFASSQYTTALERWIHCLPSLHAPSTNPSPDRVLDHALALPPPLTPHLPSPQPSNVCYRQTLRNVLLGARDAGWDLAPDMAADQSADASGDANSSMNESSEFLSSSVRHAIDESSVSPVSNSDAVKLDDAREETINNRLEECIQCEVGTCKSIATDGHANGHQEIQYLDNHGKGSPFIRTKDTVVVGDAQGIVAADEGMLVNLRDDSNDGSIRPSIIEALYETRAMDCEVNSVDKGVQGYSFPAALRLNVLSAFLWTLITNCWRKISRKRSRRQRRSSNRLHANTSAACDFPETCLRPAAEIDESKTHAENLRLGILGPALGTAVGAVFAEVFLNKSCTCKTSASAREIEMLLETAMRESLTPIVGVGPLVADFMASFQSAYRSICAVQACSRNSRVLREPVADRASDDPTHDGGKSAHARVFFNKTDNSFDQPSSKFLQQINYAGYTDDCKEGLQDLCKDIHDMGQEDSHCSKNVNKSSHLRRRKTRPTQSSISTVMDVLEKTEDRNSLADCSHFWLSEKHNSSRERGECSTAESAMADDCTLLWNVMLSPPQGNPLDEQSMALPGLGSSNGAQNEDHSFSHPFPCAQQTSHDQGACIELPDKIQYSLNLHDKHDDVEHQDRGIALSSPAELSSEDRDSQCESGEEALLQGHSDTVQPAGGLLNAVVLASQTHKSSEAGWQKAFLHLFEKSVQAQEQHNYFKSIELSHLLRQHMLGEKQLQLASVSNDLMKEHIDLSRSKAIFKKSTVLERRLNAAHVEFSRTCADELVAGLFVMLLSLVYSVRRYSSAILFDLVSTCQISAKEPHRSSWLYIDWFYNSLDSLTGQLKAFVCHVTVAGRILFGSTIVAVVSYLLLRQSVTSSSQSMSAVIIIIVLGVICGLAGKLSVDSLGGNGLYWLLMWEMLCTIHALANCFTPFIHKLVNGSLSSKKANFQTSLWVRRVIFHFTIVFVLPILAGQLPFGSISTISKDLLSVLNGTVSAIFLSCRQSMGHVI